MRWIAMVAALVAGCTATADFERQKVLANPLPVIPASSRFQVSQSERESAIVSCKKNSSQQFTQSVLNEYCGCVVDTAPSYVTVEEAAAINVQQKPTSSLEYVKVLCQIRTNVFR